VCEGPHTLGNKKFAPDYRSGIQWVSRCRIPVRMTVEDLKPETLSPRVSLMLVNKIVRIG
jgi:hypothetical protein